MQCRWFVLVGVMLCGCEKSELVVDDTFAALPAVVELHVGESVRLPQDRLTVTFEGVTQDSRCPMGAACKWEGDAAARLTLRSVMSEAEDCTLHTTLNPKSINIGQLLLQLKGVEPYPTLDFPIDAKEYIATLAIDRPRARLDRANEGNLMNPKQSMMFQKQGREEGQ